MFSALENISLKDDVIAMYANLSGFILSYPIYRQPQTLSSNNIQYPPL